MLTRTDGRHHRPHAAHGPTSGEPVVLCVTGSPEDRAEVDTAVAGFPYQRLEVVDRVGRGEELVCPRGPEILLAVIDLVGSSGAWALSLAEEIRRRHEDAGILVLGDDAPVELLLDLIRTRADDVLVRPFPPGLLEQSAAAALRRAWRARGRGLRLDRLEARCRRLQRLALRDPLTGLGNRRMLDQRLASELARAVRHGRTLSLLVIDVDGLKRVNDTGGHDAGDRALVHVAERLREHRRRYDVVCRWGGDELAVILPETPRAEALAVAEGIRESFGPRAGAPVTVSIGVAGVPEDGRSAGSVFGAADRALYEAKRLGGDRVVCSSGAEQGDGPAAQVGRS